MDETRPTEFGITPQIKATVLQALQNSAADETVVLTINYPVSKSKMTRSDITFLRACGIDARNF